MKRLRAEMSAELWGKIRENNKWDTEENPKEEDKHQRRR